jgi:hypothetical protein
MSKKGRLYSGYFSNAFLSFGKKDSIKISASLHTSGETFADSKRSCSLSSVCLIARQQPTGRLKTEKGCKQKALIAYYPEHANKTPNYRLIFFFAQKTLFVIGAD